MNILLHVCCAPCAIYPVEAIRKDGHSLAGFFYNPNIHPYSEYIKRRDALSVYSKETGLGFISGEYELEKYFQNVVYDEAPKIRCPACWWMRIEKTAGCALENGFDAFTTTLLGSPYQDSAIIQKICEEVAGKTGLTFYNKDFRIGFKEAHSLARTKGIYCQNYCGCLFSERERIDKKCKK